MNYLLCLVAGGLLTAGVTVYHRWDAPDAPSPEPWTAECRRVYEHYAREAAAHRDRAAAAESRAESLERQLADCRDLLLRLDAERLAAEGPDRWRPLGEGRHDRIPAPLVPVPER